jgi:chaperonin GroEL
MHKEIIFGNVARAAMKEGVDTLANAVKVTLGPRGRNVIIDKNFSTPHVTKDGVTVADSIILSNRVENIGASMLKDIAKKTVEEAGDGTTTSIVLAQAILTEGLKELHNGDSNPIDVQRAIVNSSKRVIDYIQSNSKEITSEEDLKNVAMISSNGDEEIANIVSNVVYNVGEKGFVHIKDYKDVDPTKTFSEFVDGIRYDAGYSSWYFCNVPEKQQVHFDNPLILVSMEKISSYGPIAYFVEHAYKTSRPIVIITEELIGEALAVLLNNVKLGKLQACVINAPGMSNQRRELLEDISVVTGAKLMGNITGYPFIPENTKEKMLGTCNKLIVDRNNTTFFIGEDRNIPIQKRIEQIKEHKELNEGVHVKAKFDQRVAILQGKVAAINIGGQTEVEIKEKIDRVDDAVKACQAALSEGISQGGGFTYLKATSILDKNDKGDKILYNVLSYPFNTIARNCGLTPEVIFSKMSETTGYNFRTDTYCNLFEDGVIDPTKVLRVALENAVSIASLLLTTEAIVFPELNNFDREYLNRPKEMVSKSYH